MQYAYMIFHIYMPCICFANLINAKCASFKDSEIKAIWIGSRVVSAFTAQSGWKMSIWMGNVNLDGKCQFGWKMLIWMENVNLDGKC